MTNPLQILTGVAGGLQRRQSLESALQLVANAAAQVLGEVRVSVRLLDPARTKLIAACRSGEPLHTEPQEFELGEGLLGWIAERGLPLRLDDAEKDPRFAARPGMTDTLGAFLGVPLMTGSTCMGVLSAVSREIGYFTPEHQDLLVLVAAIAAPQVEVARLSQLSRLDPLTGTLNRRGMAPAFPELKSGEGADPMPLSVAMVDIDHFKRVNDRFGHAVGDQALRAVSRVLAEVVRIDDAVVRYGGEEFLVILAEVDLAEAMEIAERARLTVERTELEAGDTRFHVTVSIGVAERQGLEERDDLIERADAALYRAKREGRNRTVQAG